MAALLLADRVVTLLPAPFEGTAPAAVAGAVEDSPRYLRFMESWRWTSALWRDPPVLCAAYHGETPLEEVRDVARLVGSQPDLAPLRAVLRPEFFTEGRAYLDAVSRDLLGGGDPGIAIPIRAGLERFAARHGLPLVRGEAVSVTDRLGRTLRQVRVKIDVPILSTPDGERIAGARAALAGPLAGLRAALARACRAAEPEPEASAEASAAEYASAFRSVWSAWSSRSEANEQAPKVALVSLTLGQAPSDATLRAAAAAARALPAALAAASSPPAPPDAALSDRGPVAVMEVRVLPWDFR